MTDTGRGEGLLQRAIEMAEVADTDAQKLVASVRGDVASLQQARLHCASALAGSPRNRERLEAVLGLLDAAIDLATPSDGQAGRR